MEILSIFKGMTVGMMLAAAGMAVAGNIPQYRFSTGDSEYAALSGATVVYDMEAEGGAFILPDGLEPNDFVSDGFDLGMKFRFGGREFDRFVPTTSGRILLGEGSVDNLEAFSFSFSPMRNGLRKARVSYKTEGSEGHRVFTLEYADAVCATDGAPSKFPGFYDMQIKLHEADGRAEIIFHQPLEGAPSRNGGFNVGLHGWDLSDNLFLRGRALREYYDSRTGRTVKPDYVTDCFPYPNILDSFSYLVWDSNDYEEFTVNYRFDPVLSTVAPAGSPQNLKVTQNENSLYVTADRDPEAPATVILYSTSPFTSSDYPEDGSTFLAGPDAKFGNATAIYYGDEERPSAVIENVQPNTTYYIQAISATGYPVYGTSHPARVVYGSTQAAPTAFEAKAGSSKEIDLSWKASDPVIIAATTTKEPGYDSGYAGHFSQPQGTVKQGDVLPDGGKVVYVGSAGSFRFSCEPNTLYYFRAWTLRDGVVSSTWEDAAAVGSPMLPYEPALGEYPLGEPVLDWDATSGQFTPTIMDYSKLTALRAISVEGSTATLSSPQIPIDEPVTVSFDFSLETAAREGNEPGYFGTGALRVLANDKEVYKVTEYSGTMTPTGMQGTYHTGSSTMQSEKFQLSPIGETVLTFEFRTSTFSTLYLRNLKVIGDKSGIDHLQTGEVSVIDFTAPVYNVAGVRMNVSSAAELPAGLYIVGGRKVIIRK